MTESDEDDEVDACESDEEKSDEGDDDEDDDGQPVPKFVTGNVFECSNCTGWSTLQAFAGHECHVEGPEEGADQGNHDPLQPPADPEVNLEDDGGGPVYPSDSDSEDGDAPGLLDDDSTDSESDGDEDDNAQEEESEEPEREAVPIREQLLAYARGHPPRITPDAEVRQRQLAAARSPNHALARGNKDHPLNQLGYRGEGPIEATLDLFMSSHHVNDFDHTMVTVRAIFDLVGNQNSMVYTAKRRKVDLAVRKSPAWRKLKKRHKKKAPRPPWRATKDDMKRATRLVLRLRADRDIPGPFDTTNWCARFRTCYYTLVQCILAHQKLLSTHFCARTHTPTEYSHTQEARRLHIVRG